MMLKENDDASGAVFYYREPILPWWTKKLATLILLSRGIDWVANYYAETNKKAVFISLTLQNNTVHAMVTSKKPKMR